MRTYDSQKALVDATACFQIATSFSTYDSGLAFALEAGYASDEADYDAKIADGGPLGKEIWSSPTCARIQAINDCIAALEADRKNEVPWHLGRGVVILRELLKGDSDAQRP